MLVKQIWTANAYRNFNYLVACPQTGEALAIDPLDSDKCLQAAKDEGWHITQILNTHEHHDHMGGNQAVVNATGAWGPITAALAGLEGRVKVRPGKGIHLVLDRPVTDVGVMCNAIDGRQIFIEPWGNTCLIGTTDDDTYADLDNLPVTPADISLPPPPPNWYNSTNTDAFTCTNRQMLTHTCSRRQPARHSCRYLSTTASSPSSSPNPLTHASSSSLFVSLQI